jgi:hypothetical protein
VVIFIFGLPGLVVSVVIAPVFPWLMSFFKDRPAKTPDEYPRPNLAPFYTDQSQALNLSKAFQTVCFWGLVILVVAVLVIRVRRSLARRRSNELAEPESLLKQGEAARLLRKTLQDALDGLAARLRPVRRAIIAARIRRIYIQLMELCESLGLPRLPHQTPQEFLPVMGELFTAHIDDLYLLTLAYECVRYGELPEDQAEADAIEQAWQRLQQEGSQLRKSGFGKLQTVKTEQVEKRGI